MSPDHTLDSLLDSFSQPSTPYRPIPSHPRPTSAASAASSSTSSTDGNPARDRRLPGGNRSREDDSHYNADHHVAQGHTNELDYHGDIRPIEGRIRARAERDHLAEGVTHVTTGETADQRRGAIQAHGPATRTRRKANKTKRAGPKPDEEAHELDELFEIPRARVGSHPVSRPVMIGSRMPSGKVARSGKSDSSTKRSGKRSGARSAAGMGVGDTGMRPFEDDPSRKASSDSGSDSNSYLDMVSDANSHAARSDHDERSSFIGEDLDGEEIDVETEMDVLRSIGLLGTECASELPGFASGNNHSNHHRRTREAGWRGPKEAKALRHGPLPGVFDPETPNSDLQTLYDLTTHSLRSTAFIYAGGPYVSTSNFGAGLSVGDCRPITKFSYGKGLRGTRGNFGVGILPRTG